VDPDDGAVDDRVLEVRIIRQALEKTLEDALLRPSAKAPEDRVPAPERFVQVAPGRARSGDPEDGFEKQPVVRRGAARVARLAGQQRRDPLPLHIAQDIRYKADLHFSALNQISPLKGI
jgi:hypothetical protein